MKTYQEVKEKIKEDGQGNLHLEGKELRVNYLKEIASITGRNVISYYSSFLEESKGVSSEIDEDDLVGFINATEDIDTSKGLDLILHTPGGSVEASESIVKFLRLKFNDIRVIVPQAALSAGTLLALCADSILMSSASFLGPTEPQFFSGIPASSILKEFERAKKDITKDSKKEEYYKMRLEGYPVGFYDYVKNSISIVKGDLKEWLSSYMFKDISSGSKKDKTINKIINTLMNPKKSHNYHFSLKDCENMGLKVSNLEEDKYYLLYQKILYLHYCYIISFEAGKAGKLVEADNGSSSFIPAKER
ncbi:MAG: ATP-dependent Clp protease proteolytic subunit [Coprobacillus sp.]|nr:ATP-dependent Clp protease proteolytic subunit [Coprobacillus sp.]